TFDLRSLLAKRNDRTRKRSGVAPEIVREPDLHVFDLALAGPPSELIVDLVEHAKSARADRVSKRLQTAVGVHRQITLEGECSRVDVRLCLARLRESEVLVDDKLGDRKAIVDFGHADFSARVLYADLIVDLFGRGLCLGKTCEVEIGIHPSGARTDREAH